MRISTDQQRCVGSGQCVLLAPEVFDQRDEDGMVQLLDASPPAAERGNARQAARICPAGAITLDAG